MEVAANINFTVPIKNPVEYAAKFIYLSSTIYNHRIVRVKQCISHPKLYTFPTLAFLLKINSLNKFLLTQYQTQITLIRRDSSSYSAKLRCVKHQCSHCQILALWSDSLLYSMRLPNAFFLL